MRHIIAILLQNEAGALTRVAGLFSTRGYNIESLSVAPTDDPTVSRLTLVTRGSDAVIQQIANQTNDGVADVAHGGARVRAVVQHDVIGLLARDRVGPHQHGVLARDADGGRGPPPTTTQVTNKPAPSPPPQSATTQIKYTSTPPTPPHPKQTGTKVAAVSTSAAPGTWRGRKMRNAVPLATSDSR